MKLVRFSAGYVSARFWIRRPMQPGRAICAGASAPITAKSCSLFTTTDLPHLTYLTHLTHLTDSHGYLLHSRSGGHIDHCIGLHRGTWHCLALAEGHSSSRRLRG